MKDKKKYTKPEADFFKFSIDDIITGSLGGLDPTDPPEQPSGGEEQ